jgi:hypothetical protein
MHRTPHPEPPAGSPLLPVLRWVCSDPIELLIRRWNWKSALFSSLFRGAIFFTVNLKAGREAALGAMCAEFTWRAATSGGWGAMTQKLSQVRPLWQAIVGTMLVLPAVGHSIEFTIHYLRGTPVLAQSILVSICFTQISDLFNLYVMRQGAMLTGTGSRPFGEDLRRIPALVLGFLLVLPRLAARSLTDAFSQPGARPEL